MRILQICSAREIGGGERHVVGLVNALAGRGHDVFTALTPDSPLIPELTVPKSNILELRMRNALNLRSVFRLSRFIRQQQIEVIHAHIARDYPLAAIAARRAGGVPLVLTRHVLFSMRNLHRLTFRRVARVIAVSQAVAESLHTQRLFDSDKIVVIHNGIDVDHFSEKKAQRTDGQRLRIGMIGHLASIKGQEEFIRAAAIICTHRDDVEFVIAGEDKSRDSQNRRDIEGLISELQLDERVKLIGWVDDISHLLSTFDLFVSPSRSEPFGLNIIEAMAAGVPVIATRSEGAQEIIGDDVSGVLVPIGDVNSLSQAISSLLDDPERIERFVTNARNTVLEKFSLEQMVDETENVYRQAIAIDAV